MNSSLPPNFGSIIGLIGFTNLDVPNSFKQKKAPAEFKPTVFYLQTDLVLHPADGKRVGQIQSIASFCVWGPVGWGCRIHQLHLCRGVRPPPNECPWYDSKQSDGHEAPVMLELWEMLSTSLSLLPGPLWPGVVTPDRVLSMGQIELNYNYAKLNYLKLTVFTLNCV